MRKVVLVVLLAAVLMSSTGCYKKHNLCYEDIKSIKKVGVNWTRNDGAKFDHPYRVTLFFKSGQELWIDVKKVHKAYCVYSGRVEPGVIVTLNADKDDFIIILTLFDSTYSNEIGNLVDTSGGKLRDFKIVH